MSSGKNITPSAPPSPLGEGGKGAAPASGVGEVIHTAQSFDKIAHSYDSRDNQNEILKWMRSVVHKIYLENFKEGDKLLELNAGTGVDAVFLASKGIKVHATDISTQMIEIIKSKIDEDPDGKKNITAEALSFGEISLVSENNFDGIISNFGGLNCINDFRKLSVDLHAKLKPNGKFIAVVMNKFCPWEMFYYCIRFDFKNAFRRFNKNGIDAGLNGEKVRTFYFTPKKFGEFFGNEFKIEKIYSLGYYTPPPYLIGIYNKLKPLVKLFMKTDELVKGLFLFNRFGDHFIIVLTRP